VSRLPTSLPNNIELIVHPSAVPVAYHPVINTVVPLIGDIQPDISLHLGVAEGRTYFAVEQTSQKNVYSLISDIDGQYFEDEEGDQIWGDQPERLSTALDLETVVADWQNRTSEFSWPPWLGSSLRSTALAPSGPVNVRLHDGSLDMQTEDVRWSDNVGIYLCAFIYYASMVEMSRSSVAKQRDTAFMHVPLLQEEEELQLGVDVTIELVQSLVASWRAQRAGGEA